MAELMDTRQLAAKLEMSESKLKNMRRDSEGPPFVRIGKLIRYQMPDVEKWLEKQKENA